MQALLDHIATMQPGLDARRIFHGRGGLYPGCEHLALDWFAPCLCSPALRHWTTLH